MVTYEVTLDVDPAVAAAVERYMRATHIPEILATGCFAEIRFERQADREGGGMLRFRTRYRAARRADLDRYLAQHQAHFRTDFLLHVPSGVTVTRAVWEAVEAWSLPEARMR
ncbi:MAG TPA: DUF4286 family protein [Gemmatimonadales bacterium]|nr:DUF4286 family protein [Gemmatimonadales bacterium]